jgi:glutamine synthetase
MIAAERGMVATFMPKPSPKTGSGLHLHLSLTSGGSPFSRPREDSRGLGLSETAYAFIGGILEHAGALQAVVAPTVNSYKRTGATTTASGASWAPRTPTYGGNDRTHYIRVPDSARVELRGSDGSANPYLAMAAAWARIEDRARADPGDIGGQGVRRCRDAIATRSTSSKGPADRGCADAAGGGVAGYFANIKREEFFAYHSAVTPWEIDHYLTAF